MTNEIVRIEGTIAKRPGPTLDRHSPLKLGPNHPPLTRWLVQRFAPQGNDDFANKSLTAHRCQFGGHGESASGNHQPALWWGTRASSQATSDETRSADSGRIEQLRGQRSIHISPSSGLHGASDTPIHDVAIPLENSRIRWQR
jgi:hypothetical protein